MGTLIDSVSMETDPQGWSPHEQTIARHAFDLAYGREIETLIHTLRYRCGSMGSVDAVWDLHDFLSGKRHEMDGRYDFRFATLLFVFANLVKDGLLSLDELEGLSSDKIAKISAMSRMSI
jgi:hypothetical protein